METKLKVSRIEKMKDQLRFEGYFSIDAIGRSGDLALLWKEEVLVSVVNFSQRHVTVEVKDENRIGLWLLTCFYGELDTSK